MLAVLAVGLGLACGIAAGGSPRNLGTARLRGETAILALFVLQALFRGPLIARLGELGVALWAACSVGLLAVLLVNVRAYGVSVAALGIGLNLLVVLLNGGMPVVPASPSDLRDVVAAVRESGGFYVLADQRTMLAVLGDVLPAGGGMASVGDVLLVLGVAVFMIRVMVEPSRGGRVASPSVLAWPFIRVYSRSR